VFARYHLMRDRLLPDITVVKDVRSSDLLVRPAVGYKPGDHWQLALGLDVFSGPGDHLFGQYSNRDRIYTNASYYF
jgi:hypothetical protein